MTVSVTMATQSGWSMSECDVVVSDWAAVVVVSGAVMWVSVFSALVRRGLVTLR